MKKHVWAVLWCVSALCASAPAQDQPHEQSREQDYEQPYDDLLPPEWVERFDGYTTYTEPGRSATMGFDEPTSITEVLVKGGDRVKQGDLLLRGDDAEALALYETQVIQIADDLDVQRLEKIYDLRVIQYERTKGSFEQGAATSLELAERKAAMEVADVELRLGQMEYEQAKIALARFQARLDRLRLHAPFDGIVETVEVDVGESVNEQDPVLRVVNIDKLQMNVQADTDLTLRLDLAPGSPAWVLIEVKGEPRVYKGAVTEVSPVAYYATRQRSITVEMPNPDAWPAGMAAWARFTEPEGSWEIVSFDETGAQDTAVAMNKIGQTPASPAAPAPEDDR